jgi:ssDNA-binding Zn-finger/Zn-ribbon topoisomerase 1
MKWLLFVLVLIAVVALVILKRRNNPTRDEGESFPYVLGDGLFSPAERSFLGVLDQAVGNDFRVFGKVRVADVVAVAKGTPKSLWQRAFNRISAKHFDYVLCNRSDLKPICAIELNDQSHAQDNRKGRDKFLEDVCAAAKLPLIFIPAQRSYTLPEVGQAIAGVIGRNGVVPTAVGLATVEQSPVFSTAPEVVSNAAADPACPRCSSPMVRRIAKSGENAGKEFWGCTKFPACRGVVLL